MPHPRIERLARLLARHTPARAPAAEDLPRASVALIVRPAPDDLELLLIRRAERAGDPWSGHMALPGGRQDAGDPDSLATAARESLEEVGVALSRDQALGRLDDVRPISGAPRIAVSAWVFGVPERTATQPNHEVDLTVWVPLDALAAPGAATEYLHALTGGETLRFPAFGYQDHVIWGLTHRILTQFLEIARGDVGQGGAR